MPKINTQIPSDYMLVCAVGDRRDRAAFTEIYKRYQLTAMGLLLNILSDQNRAEDALQEAFLRIWLSAHTLRDERNVRGWILRIVAREGARCYTSPRNQRTAQVENIDNMPVAAADQTEAAQHVELLAAMDQQLETLDPAQRTVLALHYGGGLSQREIGEVLGLTQQGVGHRINEALDTLRHRLNRAGFAAALPLLSADGLSWALTQGSAPEARLFDGILEKLEQGGRLSARAAKGGAGTFFWVAGVLIAAVGAGLFWMEVRAPVTKPKPAITELAAMPPDPNRERFHKRWTFERGVPEDIEVVAGKWALAKHVIDGTLAVAAAPDSTIFLRLPVPNAAVPNELEIQVCGVNGMEKDLKFIRIEGNRAPPMTLWRDEKAGLDNDSDQMFTMRARFDGFSDISTINGVLASVARIDEQPKSMSLLIIAQGMAILSIEYRELEIDKEEAEGSRKGIVELEARGIKARKVSAQVFSGL